MLFVTGDPIKNAYTIGIVKYLLKDDYPHYFYYYYRI